MFVRYFVEVPLPVDRVEVALLTSPAGWLSALAGVAQERGDGLLTEVGVGDLGAGRAGRAAPPSQVAGQAEGAGRDAS